MLTIDDLPDGLFLVALMHFGVDKVWWWRLNKPFYPNRPAKELIIGGYLLKYKNYRGDAYVVEVTKLPK